MRTHLALLALLVGAGVASLAWQIEGPTSASASARPVLVCPLGAHGLAPAPFPRVASSDAGGVMREP